MMPDITLVILAAGIGSRFGGPKQLVVVGPNGETMINYAIYDAYRAGIKNIVIVTREEIKSSMEKAVSAQIREYNQNLMFVIQSIPSGRIKPQGTAHAVLCCKDIIDTPFVVVNGDDFYGLNSYEQAVHWLTEGSKNVGKIGNIVFKLKQTLSRYGAVSRGICRLDSSNNIKIIEEIKKIPYSPSEIGLTGEEYVSMNMWLLFPWIFTELEYEFGLFVNKKESLEEFMLPLVITDIASKYGITISAVPSSGIWMGITYPEDVKEVKEKIQNFINSGLYPSKIY